MDSKQRVAVIGASGIGKHHAKWWAMEGAEVCAIAGASDVSVAKAAEGVKALFAFDGRTYTDVPAMLETECPDIVDVCSPGALHHAHTKTALQAGCHVLCEKPFVYDPELPHDELMGQARELVELARASELLLGVCIQYVVCARVVREAWEETHRGQKADTFRVHLASPCKGRAPDPERVWVDLGPHPLSGLQDMTGGGEILWDTVRTQFSGYEARARFDARRATGELIECEIITANTTEPPNHIREVSLDGNDFVIGGENDENGVYCARIDTVHGSYVRDDFMRVLIRDFLAGAPAADGEMGLTNLEWLLHILRIARAQG